MQLFVVLDNIRSALNVGAIFRTADSFGVEKIFLCGTTPRPGQTGPSASLRASKDLAKTSLGAENFVPWEYRKRTIDAVKQLRKQGFRIVALEQAKNSIDIRRYKPKAKVALVLGFEVSGVSKSVLKQCDKIIEIPMLGKKESLNVSVAFGVASYLLKFRS